METTTQKILTIKNKLGLHARPAALFVQTANRFGCEIEVTKDGETVNGKSIMGIMTLAVGVGMSIDVKAIGADAADAMAALESLVETNFGEEE